MVRRLRTGLPSTFFAVHTAQGERREAAVWSPRAEFMGRARVRQEFIRLPETPGCQLICHATNATDAPLTVAILYSRGVPIRQSAPIPELLCRWTECDEFVMVSANVLDSGEGYAMGVVRDGAHVTFGQWETLDEGDELGAHFTQSGALSPRFASDRECILSPALAIATRFDLPPRGAKSVTFVWAWWLPGQPQGVPPFANVQQVAHRLLQIVPMNSLQPNCQT